MMSVHGVLIIICSLLMFLCQYGDTAATGNPQAPGIKGPTFVTVGSLIACARSCYDKPNCAIFVYGKFDASGVDCGYGTDPKAAEGLNASKVISFTMIRDKSEKVEGNSYVQLDSKTPTFSLSTRNESAFLIGNDNQGKLLKITTTIQCENCTGKHSVSVYNVRENTKDPIPPNDQSEGAVVCQEAMATTMTSVFLAANGSYALVRIGRASTSTGSIKGKVTFSMEKWGTSYNCSDCTAIKTLPNMCSPEAWPIFKRFVDFHTIAPPTVLPTSKSGGNSPTSMIKIPGVHPGSDRTKRATGISRTTPETTLAMTMSPNTFTQLAVSSTEPTNTTSKNDWKIPEIPSDSDGTNGPSSTEAATTNTTRRNRHRGNDDDDDEDKTTTPSTNSASKSTHKSSDVATDRNQNANKDGVTGSDSLSTPVTSLSDSSSTRKPTTPKPRSDRDKDDKNDDDDTNEDNKNENDNNNNNNNNNNGNNGNQAGQQTSSSGGTSVGSGVVGGAVGGVLAAVAVLAVVGAVLYRRHKKNKVEPSEVEINLDDHVPGSVPPCHHDSNALVVRQTETPPPSSSSAASSPPPPPSSSLLPSSSSPPPPPSTTKTDEEC